jgi:hypothetical protein
MNIEKVKINIKNFKYFKMEWSFFHKYDQYFGYGHTYYDGDIYYFGFWIGSVSWSF